MSRLSDIIGTDIHAWEVAYRVHATRRMFQRGIEEHELLFILENGRVIEEYEKDLPFPSLLLNGRTPKGRTLHVVVAIDASGKSLFVITTYEPDSSKWTDDFSRRTS
ncbi:MAG: DUF4258 domain-containing protein [Candidatus Latescibacteria bacterium]|nr:DUF4258 domain-containing protein [Candidatus Latescibacterota bacterium]